MKLAAAALFSILTFLSLTAAAQTPADDRGIYARLAIGAGGSKHYASEGAATLGGAGATYELAVGYRLATPFVVHLTYFGARAFAPTLELKGKERKVEEGAESSLNAVGLGITYERGGFFASPSLGISIIEGVDTAPAKRDVMNPGFAAGLTLGYEFRLSQCFRLGLAASVAYFQGHDDGPVDQTWQGFAAGPAISVSYDSGR